MKEVTVLNLQWRTSDDEGRRRRTELLTGKSSVNGLCFYPGSLRERHAVYETNLMF